MDCLHGISNSPIATGVTEIYRTKNGEFLRFFTSFFTNLLPSDDFLANFRENHELFCVLTMLVVLLLLMRCVRKQMRRATLLDKFILERHLLQIIFGMIISNIFLPKDGGGKLLCNNGGGNPLQALLEGAVGQQAACQL